MIKKIKPDYVLTFTTKPNIYCPMVAKILGLKKSLWQLEFEMFDQNKIIKKSFKIFLKNFINFQFYFLLMYGLQISVKTYLLKKFPAIQ